MVYKHCLTCMSLSKLFTSDVLGATFQGSISPLLGWDMKNLLGWEGEAATWRRYTVTAGYIFCSPPACGNGDWICL